MVKYTCKVTFLIKIVKCFCHLNRYNAHTVDPAGIPPTNTDESNLSVVRLAGAAPTATVDPPVSSCMMVSCPRFMNLRGQIKRNIV